MNPIPHDNPKKQGYVHGVFTDIIEINLSHAGIHIPLIEAPVKESLRSPATEQFWSDLKQAVETCH